MWAILMIVLFVSAFAGIIYLINRIGKFGFLNKITKGKSGCVSWSVRFWYVESP